MATGFGALATRAPVWHLRFAIIFGIALGLTLDEFAMWLHLADVYWSPDGIESLKASAVVAALLAVYGCGQPFWHAIARDILHRSLWVDACAPRSSCSCIGFRPVSTPPSLPSAIGKRAHGPT